MTLKTRLEKLESQSTAGTIAAKLGGMAVVTRIEGEHYRTRDGRTLTADELRATLAGCSGKLLVLGWPSR